ncbi:MAG: hypothetical protein HYU76_10305 [Betaproteobacteria bacterium]|nr:hypothetical protein [Betaproteobacteria bacterium]
MSTHGMETIGGVEVYAPTGEVGTEPRKLAPRIRTLRGKRIALLDNCKEFADQVLKGVAEVLRRDYGVGEVRFWRKGYPAKGAPFIKELAASCDAAINGVGH